MITSSAVSGRCESLWSGAGPFFAAWIAILLLPIITIAGAGSVSENAEIGRAVNKIIFRSTLTT